MLHCTVKIHIYICTEHIEIYLYIVQEYKGLPTKDETSETTVQNLHCLFPYIYYSLQS